MMVRMMAPGYNEICEAAVALKATHFVMVEDWHIGFDKPIWGVFEMRTAEKDTPQLGTWSIRDPIRKFTADTPDGAVMFALAQQL